MSDPVFVIVPIASRSTVDAMASEVDAKLGYPRCECAACARARGEPSPDVGMGPFAGHNVNMTQTYAHVLVSADGTRAAYLYDDVTAPIIGSASASPLPADWYPPATAP